VIGPQLQQAIYAALIAADITGGRVYDRPPDNPEFPYTTIGDEQVIDDSNSCDAAWEVFDDVHVWSRPATGSKVELKAAVAAVVDALAVELDLDGFIVAAGMLDGSRTLRDPDGLTEHAIVTLRYLVNPA
jgi:hypothetical protein